MRFPSIMMRAGPALVAALVGGDLYAAGSPSSVAPARTDTSPSTRTATVDAQVDAQVDARYAAIEALVLRGRPDAAERQLAAADFPAGARARLQGLIAMQRGEHETAERFFTVALRERPADLALRLYLAQSQLLGQRPKAALRTLEGTQSLAKKIVAQPLLLARARISTGDPDGAYAALEAATRDFPREVAPRVELVALCADEGLMHTARAWARPLLRARVDRETVLVVLGALYRDEGSLPLLEEFASVYPEDAEVLAHLAHGYAAADRWLAAATVFERATHLGGSHAFEAADQYRMAGDTRRALTLNARVADEYRRVDQRLRILVAAGEMARVVALGPTLRRLGLLTPEHRYSLAYAHFGLGQHVRATNLARGLLATKQAARARSLLAAMGRGSPP